MLPNLIILYVEDPTASAAFYGKLLDREPVFAVPTYVSFDLGSGFMLGLLSKSSPAAVSDKGFEFAFLADGPEAVDQEHQRWRDAGIDAAQPFDAQFGRTFTAPDLDGNLLRVCLAD
ncbi:glyoxalase [Mesorhizobium sediminum]|nr:glyoxalase [Mesorhizobium sediminum]